MDNKKMDQKKLDKKKWIGKKWIRKNGLEKKWIRKEWIRKKWIRKKMDQKKWITNLLQKIIIVDSLCRNDLRHNLTIMKNVYNFNMMYVYCFLSSLTEYKIKFKFAWM